MPTYTGIKSEAFRHPLDKEAEQALRNLPGFDLVARKFVEFVYEKQVYKFLLYNNIAQGIFITHPFTVERIRHLQEWANSEEYRQIRQGNYQHTTTQAVNVTSEASPSDVETLKRQIEKLQQEINQIKCQSIEE